MSFLSSAIDKLTGHHEHHGGGGQYYEGSGPSQSPPMLSYPFTARWESSAGRWLFINTANGSETFDYPGPGSQPQPGGVGHQQSQGGYGQNAGQGYGYGGGPQQGGYYEEDRHHEKKHGHGMAYGAMGAAAGVAGGMALMHEGEKIDDAVDYEKYRMEGRVADGVQDVEDFPENAAGWTGRKVGEVEGGFDAIGDGIERRYDDAVDDVEDFPQNAAGWAGEKVGEVEGFADSVDDAYDAGRDDGRYQEEEDDGGW